jgi:hypothetical protein
MKPFARWLVPLAELLLPSDIISGGRLGGLPSIVCDDVMIGESLRKMSGFKTTGSDVEKRDATARATTRRRNILVNTDRQNYVTLG